MDRRQDEGAAPRDASLVAAVLCGKGPIPMLTDAQLRIGAALLAGVPEPGVGERCNACGEIARERHWRSCKKAWVPPGQAHDAVAKAGRLAYRGGEGVRTRGPRHVGVGGYTAIDDGAILTAREIALLELKSRDTWSKSWTAKVLHSDEDVELAVMEEKYAEVNDDVKYVYFTLDGLVTKRTLPHLQELERMFQEAGLAGAYPSVTAQMGAALIRQQTAQWMCCASAAATGDFAQAAGARAAANSQ